MLNRSDTTGTTTSSAPENDEFISCWNDILTPKWIRFRHLLSGNGKLHSDVAIPRFGIRLGDRVLDFGCGFGETSLELGRRVGPSGEVLGLDCTSSFIDIANRERDEAGLSHVRYELGDAQVHRLEASHFDVAFARFGVMFFESAVRALRNVHAALVPGGKVCLIVWRSLVAEPRGQPGVGSGEGDRARVPPAARRECANVRAWSLLMGG
jgi:ubiquinone/menaquinone biosynthesis C-methylase UbiE